MCGKLVWSVVVVNHKSFSLINAGVYQWYSYLKLRYWPC